MERIPLTQGLFALVDDEDYEALSKYKWHIMRTSYTVYAVRRGSPVKKHIKMHEHLIEIPDACEAPLVEG